MQRIQIQTTGWGYWPNALNSPVTLANLDSTSAVIYASKTGAAAITSPMVDNSGNIAGYVDPNSYLLTINGRTYQVDAVPGTSMRVVAEGPINIMYPEYGAKIDNSSDDAPAWALVAAALPSTGGTIFVPKGVGKFSAFPSFAGRRNVRIFGEGSQNDAGGFGSTLIYTGIGPAAAIDARKTIGFQLEGLNLLYGSNLFTGYYVDFRNDSGSGANDTRMGGVKNCMISGQSGSWVSAKAGLGLANAVAMKFETMRIQGCDIGVMGREVVGDYCNSIMFDTCDWGSNQIAHTKNAGEAWNFKGGTVEGLVGSKAGFYTHDAGIRGLGFKVDGVWMGDVTVAGGLGAQIKWSGHGLVLAGGRLGVEVAGVEGIIIDENNCHGIMIMGTCGVGPGGPMLDFGSTSGHTGVFVMPGDESSMQVTGGTIPAGAMVWDTNGNFANNFTFANAAIIQRLIGAGSNAAHVMRLATDTQDRWRLTGDGTLTRTLGTNADNVVDALCIGTPEGQITGGKGSQARRLDGGAGTTLYVKESGTGNTGWVGK